MTKWNKSGHTKSMSNAFLCQKHDVKAPKTWVDSNARQWLWLSSRQRMIPLSDRNSPIQFNLSQAPSSWTASIYLVNKIALRIGASSPADRLPYDAATAQTAMTEARRMPAEAFSTSYTTATRLTNWSCWMAPSLSLPNGLRVSPLSGWKDRRT